METSMTTKLRITLHKADNLPKKVATLTFPLLETSDKFVVHGFAYANYLDDLEDASSIFAEGASLDLAMADCFIQTRNWLMDTYDLIEEETIALSKCVDSRVACWMLDAALIVCLNFFLPFRNCLFSVFFAVTTAVDFGVTQVVDGNWGVHADIPKWALDETDDVPYDYSCATSGPGRRRLQRDDSSRRELFEQHGIVDQSPEDYASALFSSVTKGCHSCSSGTTTTMVHHRHRRLAEKLLDAKLVFLQRRSARR